MSAQAWQSQGSYQDVQRGIDAVEKCLLVSFLQLLRDSRVNKICNVCEGLIEALLEQQAYSEVQVSLTHDYHTIVP